MLEKYVAMVIERRHGGCFGNGPVHGELAGGRVSGPGHVHNPGCMLGKALLNSLLLSTTGNLSKGEDTETTGGGCMQFVRTGLAPSSVH